MIAQNNVTHMYVGADAALATTAAPTTARYLGKKEIGETLCEAGACAAGDRFQLLYLDKNSKLQISPMLTWSNLLYKNKVSAAAATSQSVVVGFNGTTGSIEVNNLENYLITLGYMDSLKQFGNKSLYKYSDYTSGASATQYAIANGLHSGIIANMVKDPYIPFIVEKLNSGTSVATSGGAFTVVNGSKTVTTVESAGGAADAAKYDTDGADIAVGDLIRFGHATTKTFVVYKVAAITIPVGAATATITLDQPYSGASGTVAANATGVIAAASEGDYGIRIKGNDSAKPWELGKWAYDPIRFDVGLSEGFGDTITTVEAVASKGHGTYYEVAQMEYELIGNRMEPYKIAEYPISFPGLGATAGETYTLYTLQFKDDTTQTFFGTADSYITIVVASAGATLTAALDTLFGF